MAEQALLTSSLDYYKATMSQAAWLREPAAQVTFSLHNRGPERLLDNVDPRYLTEQLDEAGANGWQESERQYLGSLAINGGDPAFHEQYLTYLKDRPLPAVEVRHDKATDDLAIETTGDWPLVSFWETTVMSAVSELYFKDSLKRHDISLDAVYREGDRRLSEKIAVLRSHPDIKIADFGTRRRFSLDWHDHVVERLATECPDNLVGTSNIGLAHKYNLKPIGTFAHEMPMVYAALADIRGQDVRGSHRRFLEDWYSQYGTEYSIALTDTFGSDFFFQDFTPEQARAWRGVRQDSGDPFVLGERLIRFYKQLGIDPKTKVVVFSDALDFDKIVKLHQRFDRRLAVLDGIGTNLTNDLGMRALNQVMKATHVRIPEGQASTVKISDDAGKQTGPPDLVHDYQYVHFRAA